MQLPTFFVVRTDSVETTFGEAAEEEAEELGEDFIRHKYNEGAQQDEPEIQIQNSNTNTKFKYKFKYK